MTDDAPAEGLPPSSVRCGGIEARLTDECRAMRYPTPMKHISGDGAFTKKCHAFLESELGVAKALLTTSCTHALEMSAILLGIQPGDEVIIPDFTFGSTQHKGIDRGDKGERRNDNFIARLEVEQQCGHLQRVRT